MHIGQQSRRDYSKAFDKSCNFGKPTPNDPSGSLVRGTMNWDDVRLHVSPAY